VQKEELGMPDREIPPAAAFRPSGGHITEHLNMEIFPSNTVSIEGLRFAVKCRRCRQSRTLVLTLLAMYGSQM
jgi:hypothetical protein